MLISGWQTVGDGKEFQSNYLLCTARIKCWEIEKNTGEALGRMSGSEIMCTGTSRSAAK